MLRILVEKWKSDDVDMENIATTDATGPGFVVVIVRILDLMYGCYI